MRIFLLRALIGWWFIPLIWMLIFPLAWLIEGFDDAVDEMKGTSHLLWYGA